MEIKTIRHSKELAIPKIFWKYYDLYRRKLLSIDEFSQKTNISKETLLFYLSSI